MDIGDIIALRLRNQQVKQSEFKTSVELVKWLGAIQAQDYAAAKWAIGLRLPNTTDKIIDKAFNAGEILRTHVMRPTWHFVAPEDIRWLIELTAPRVKAQCAHMNRKMELGEEIFKRCNKIIIKALKGCKYLTRAELGGVLEKAGITVNDLRLTYITLRAELDAVICSGPRNGKQFTYALLDERVAESATLNRDEAIAELTKRYFTSHGPATLQDFAWWSGLTISDAKAGIEMVSAQLQKEIIDGRTYLYSNSQHQLKAKTSHTSLLPIFDEYIIAYKERSLIFDRPEFNKTSPRGNALFNNTIITDGKVIGTWKRTFTKNKVIIEPTIFIKLTKAQKNAIADAADNYGAFIGMDVILNW